MNQPFPELYTGEKMFQENVLPFMVFTTCGETQQTMHSHDYVQMWYVLNGHYRHYFNGQNFELGRGNLFILPPYMGHYIDSTGCKDVKLITCEFSEDFIRAASNKNDEMALFNLVYLEPILIHCNQLKPSLYFHDKAASEIETLLGELLTEYQKQDKFFSMLIKANMIKLLALIARQYETLVDDERNSLFAKYRSAIDRALEYIEENYMDKIYLEDVCKIALMSPSAFSNIFKHSTGSTFTEYLLYRRVLKSRELLMDLDRSVTDICYECGFNDPTYFHRVFKKITGFSPGQYRKINEFE